MIKSYLAHLELRIQAISQLLGNVSDLKEPLLKDIREGVNEVVSKLHKDNARKFQRIKKVIEKYDTVIDTMATSDKLTLVNAQLQEIAQVVAQLDRIQKLVPALNTDNYLKYKADYQHIRVLNTCSQVEETLQKKIAVKSTDDQPLINLRSQHRKGISELAELNAQIIKNLSTKLQSLSNRKLKEAPV